MGDLIRRSAALETIDEVDISDCTDIEDIIDRVYAEVASVPTIDAVPVVHARWKMTDSPYCSHCKHIAVLKYRYCPNCGARMDAEEDK